MTTQNRKYLTIAWTVVFFAGLGHFVTSSVFFTVLVILSLVAAVGIIIHDNRNG